MIDPLPYDRADLCARVDGGAAFRYAFFWGHAPPADGQAGPWLFSQWAASAFDVDGARYPTAEHWMMAEKARALCLMPDHLHLTG